MKKMISFVLVALMLLTFLVGCHAYRRADYGVRHHDGNMTTRGHVYRHDGVTPDRNVRDTNRSPSIYNYDRTDRYHHYRNDGMVTDRDGLIGNGSFADRPAPAVRDGVRDGVRTTVPYQREGTVSGVAIPSTVPTATPTPAPTTPAR
ncbi:MAG: hypothetical protein FWC72_07985 [Oscillospiraceae bacterium]|nr:hypothetical protein [Oscillospiraceae bacterium]